jgi:hypothetical protein
MEMAQLQAYQGYFQADGRFVPDNLLVKIPTNKRVIVNILVDEPTEIANTLTVDENEIAKRREAVNALKGCLAGLSDVDLDQVREERILSRGGL